MTDLEKILHIEFGQLIDKMNNGLIHTHTTKMKLVEKAMETFALYNVVGQREQLVCDLCNQPYTKEELKVGHCFNCGEQNL